MRTTYNITALELHERIIEDMRWWLMHNSYEIPWWMDNHHERPLEQTITMTLGMAADYNYPKGDSPDERS